MIRIGIVEDDEMAIERLISHLDRFQRDVGDLYHTFTFHDGADLLSQYRPNWDVLFLDVQMPRVDGMSAARRIREIDSEVIIVFITGSPHYAVSGYEVDALSYLIKPVPYPSFEQEMSRIVSRLQRRSRRELLFTATDGVHHRVAVDDIRYIESVRHRVDLRTLDDTFSIATSLRAMETQLADSGLLRCHNGLLVNLRHVIGIDGNDCRIRGGGILPISRPRKREFFAALAEYVGSRGISA